MDKFPQNVILSGVSMILSTNHGGIIEHETLDSVKIGYFENSNLPLEIQETRCKRLINKHNECVCDDNVKLTRWRKLVYNATLNSVCTLTGVDVGRLELWGANDTITRKAMREVLEIAKSNGVEVPESTIEEMLGQMGFITHHMLVDIRKGNYIEVEVILGNAVRTAMRNGVVCPILTLIYNLLRVVQMRTKEAKGAITVPP